MVVLPYPLVFKRKVIFYLLLLPCIGRYGRPAFAPPAWKNK